VRGGGHDWTFTHGDEMEELMRDLMDPPQEYLEFMQEFVE
jgi:hypothetical protein